MLDEIICGDCLEVMPTIPDNSINLIITDPPYGINKGKIDGDESLQIWVNSLYDCSRVLKPDSFYCTFASIAKLNVVLMLASAFFSYRWTTLLYINNGMVRGSVGFSAYVPCVVFMNGNAKIKKQIRDVREVSAKKPQHHPYEKNIRFMTDLVEAFSHPEDTVLDPFSGSGTTAVAAKATGRHYICIEKEPEYCAIAEKRIAEML